MSYLVLKDRRGGQPLPVKVFEDPRPAQALLQPMRWKILQELATGDQCARELAKRLGTSQQVVCYHLKELEKAGFIRLQRRERRRGAIAKYYRAEHRAIAVIASRLGELDTSTEETNLSEASMRLLAPYVTNGVFDGHIVVGSPDQHGIFRERDLGGYHASYLAFFLGSLLPLARSNVVKLDTELTQQQILENLILVGNPRVNTIAVMMNEFLPITYELAGPDVIMSTISERTYAEPQDGAVQMIRNPMNPESQVFVLAGNETIGTQAAIMAFVRYTEDVAAGNVFNREIVARVVSGVDANQDGLIDDVEFLE
ncbi:ArsR family transcriptional regulator [[Eubacterium] cellulosolvens]